MQSNPETTIPNKGGIFLYALYDGSYVRATTDIDFLAQRISNDVTVINRYNNRMSAIGITKISDGVITDSLFSYVNPEVPFDSFNIELTGIDDFTVEDAPTFSELWETIKPWMESGVLVAHNAVFDLSVLKACLTAYNITWKKSVRYLCTVQAGRKLLPGMKHNLNILCDY